MSYSSVWSSVPGATACVMIGLMVACRTVGNICRLTAPPRWIRPRTGGFSFASVPRPGAPGSLRRRPGRPFFRPRVVGPYARRHDKPHRPRQCLPASRQAPERADPGEAARSSPARPRHPGSIPERSAGWRGSAPSDRGTRPTRGAADDVPPAPCQSGRRTVHGTPCTSSAVDALSFIMAVADDHGTVAVRAAHAIRPAMLTHKFKALGLVQQAREIDHLGYRHACAASSNNRITSSSDQIRDLASALPHPEPPPRNPTRATTVWLRHIGGAFPSWPGLPPRHYYS